MKAFPHGDSVLLALLTINQLNLHGSYRFFGVGTWDLHWVFVPFFWCFWYWPCCWLHPQSCSKFYRRVGILVFMWCGFVHLHPRKFPSLHPHRIECVRLWIFILHGCGFFLFDLSGPIWLCSRGFAGVGGVIMTGLSHGKRLGEISGPFFFTLGAICVS